MNNILIYKSCFQVQINLDISGFDLSSDQSSFLCTFLNQIQVLFHADVKKTK
jgi:hypothetical protein